MFVTIIKPFAAASVCAVCAYFSQMGLSVLLNGSRLSTVVALCVAAFAYLVALSVFKCITKEDIITLPKGDKLADICAKLHIIR